MIFKNIFKHAEAREKANNAILGLMTPEKKAIKGVKKEIFEELADAFQYSVWGLESYELDKDIYKEILEHLWSAYELTKLLNH